MKRKTWIWLVLVIAGLGLGVAVQASVGAISLNAPASFPVDI